MLLVGTPEKHTTKENTIRENRFDCFGIHRNLQRDTKIIYNRQAFDACMLVVTTESSPCPSSAIKVFLCHISLNSMQGFARGSVTDR